MPELEQLRRHYEARGVGFLALSLDPDVAKARRTLAALGVAMPAAVARGEVLGPLRVAAVPSTVFVDARGVIAMTATGERSRGFFERRVEALLEAGP